MTSNTEAVPDSSTPRQGIRELWNAFRDAGGDEFFRSWLALQSTMTGNAVQGLLVLGEPDDGSYAPVAQWSVGAADLARLTDICESVLEQRCGLLAELPPTSSVSPPPPDSVLPRYAVAYPVLVDDLLYGVVALEVYADGEGQLAMVMQQLQWGGGWLELYYRRRRIRDDAASLAGIKSSFDLLAAIVAEKDALAAVRVFVTELATLFRCDRVSLGLMKQEQVKIQAISHSAQFSKNVSLVRSIALAMEEALLQKSELVFPRREGMKALVTRAHEEFSRQQGDEAILTVPLYDGGNCLGALTLERPADLPFLEDEVSVCRAISALAAPILEDKRRESRLILFKVADSLRKQASRLVGSGYVGRKLTVLLMLGVVVFFSLATGDYRITADSVLEPSIRRSIVSPFNGYVKDAAARPGDVVKKGALLCTLDDKDLYLERTRLANQVVQYQRQRQEALATADRAKVNIITAQLSQAEAQINLVRGQLKRTSLVAPFDGIVVNGDLSQRIDGAVEQGEVLFELAPLSSYRVILQVDEYRIDEVRPGQRGTLVLPALTDRTFEFSVNKITPLSAQKEGKNYFRVEATLDRVEAAMRPGMEGVGKVMVDRRRLVSIWTRDLVDWLRLKVWYWWP